jgi:hypothetical protein
VDKTVEIEITKAELEEKFFKGQSALVLWQDITLTVISSSDGD